MNPETNSYPERAKLPAAEIQASRRHLFLCLGPDCCPAPEGERIWLALKKGCHNLGIPVLRTKAACLRVCQGGPWLVVYPEGTWYGGVDEAKLDRILREHIVLGRPVKEWVSVCSGCHSPD